MRKIIFLTVAYNAEKTLPNAIESILNQKYKNMEYYICNNGSQDKTGEIIESYAKHDNRIISLSNEVNGVGLNVLKIIVEFVLNNSDDVLFTTLDSDDEYKPGFLERMLPFLEENNLDVAACGSDFINTQSNIVIGQRRLSNDLILDRKESFGKFFANYHQFMRTVWGKLYCVSVLKQCDYKNYFKAFNKVYGSDTLLCMRAFSCAKRAGILAESLHKYYVSTKSVSYKFSERRIVSDQILHDETTNFLVNKAGYVSAENRDFLLWVYFNAIKDTLNILINSSATIEEKLNYLHDMFTSSQTRELAEYRFYESSNFNSIKLQLFKDITDWMVAKKETRSENGIEIFSDILAVVGIIPTQFNGWSGSETFVLLTKVKEKSKSVAFGRQLKNQIVAIASQQTLLNGFSAEFLIFFSDLVDDVLNEKFDNALKKIMDVIDEEKEIPAGMGIPLLSFGLNISAKLNIIEHFIYFKKLQVTLLLEAGQREQAKVELADWDELVPSDQDFKELRIRVGE